MAMGRPRALKLRTHSTAPGWGSVAVNSRSMASSRYCTRAKGRWRSPHGHMHDDRTVATGKPACGRGERGGGGGGLVEEGDAVPFDTRPPRSLAGYKRS